MSAHSADLSVIQQQDPVGIHDGRDALGHDDPGHIFVVPAQGCVESSFGFQIQGAGRIIKDQNI